MYRKAIICPLDIQGELYSLQDEKGTSIGTGTREVCEVLLNIITRPTTTPTPVRSFWLGSGYGGTTVLVPQKRYVRVR